MRGVLKWRYPRYYLSCSKNIARCYNSLSQGARSKPLITEKKQPSLGCNGAPGSPGSLETIPHVLLASTWQTNLKRIAIAVELSNISHSNVRKRGKIGHSFRSVVGEKWFFVLASFPSLTAGSLNSYTIVFAWLLESSTTCLKTASTDQINRVCIFQI